MKSIAAILRGILRLLRSAAFLGFFVVLLLVSNFAVLTVDAAHDVMKRGLYQAASILVTVDEPRTWKSASASARRLEERAGREHNGRLRAEADARVARTDAERARLATDRAEADARQARADARRARTDAEAARSRAAMRTAERDLQTRNARWAQRELQDITDLPPSLMVRLARTGARADLSALPHLSRETRDAARAANARLARRTAVGMSRNIGSMALEVVPVTGVAVIVGLTIMEVKDACDTLADSRLLDTLLNGEAAEEPPACGYSADEIWSYVSGDEDEGNCTSTEDPVTGLQKVTCGPLPAPGGDEEDETTTTSAGPVQQP